MRLGHPPRPGKQDRRAMRPDADRAIVVVFPAGRGMKHQGSCHCGRIAFELEADVTDAIDCNCSMCRRRGGLLAFFPREALTLKTPESDYRTYYFNKEKLAHHFCPNCGIAPFSEGVNPKTGQATAAVNVRCLPDVDLAKLKIVHVDGAKF